MYVKSLLHTYILYNIIITYQTITDTNGTPSVLTIHVFIYIYIYTYIYIYIYICTYIYQSLPLFYDVDIRDNHSVS
jgi:hypothetical protein